MTLLVIANVCCIGREWRNAKEMARETTVCGTSGNYAGVIGSLMFM